MKADELAWIKQILTIGHDCTDTAFEVVEKNAEAARDARGGGPVIMDGPVIAEVTARMGGFIVGDGLSAIYAGDLRLSDDRRGLVYASEKTYDMIAGVNFIIVNARTRIPDFRLQGTLAADTEFKPYIWFVKIGKDGLAFAEKATREEFFAFRRNLYPNGYHGNGLIDPEERNRQSFQPTLRERIASAIRSRSRRSEPNP
jgi:hypothetical protein